MARTTLHWTGPAASAGHDARQAMPAKRGVKSPAHFQTSDRPRRWRLAVEQVLKDPLEYLRCLRCGSQFHHGCLLTGSRQARFRLPARWLGGLCSIKIERSTRFALSMNFGETHKLVASNFPPESSEAAESRHPSFRCAPLGCGVPLNDRSAQPATRAPRRPLGSWLTSSDVPWATTCLYAERYPSKRFGSQTRRDEALIPCSVASEGSSRRFLGEESAGDHALPQRKRPETVARSEAVPPTRSVREGEHNSARPRDAQDSHLPLPLADGSLRSPSVNRHYSAWDGST